MFTPVFSVLFLVTPVCITEHENQGGTITKLVTEKEHENYIRFFPKSDSGYLERLKSNPNLMFYNERVMPRAYQYDGGVHSVFHNIAISKRLSASERFGNANREFPWKTTVGMDNVSNGSVINFIVFADNRIEWRRLPGNTVDGPRIEWLFPKDTVLGEILLVTDTKGYSHTFEVRTRTRTDDRWKVAVYRPYATWKDFTTGLQENHPDWWGDRTLLSWLNQKSLKQQRVLRDFNPTATVVNLTGSVDNIPSIPEPVVKKLLKTEFRSVLNRQWANNAFAPSTKEKFSIVPTNYQAEAVAMNSTSCMTCHESVGKSAKFFDRSREWYGYVRGSDTVFSFHIFDPASISKDGTNRPIVFRKEFKNLLQEVK